MRATRCHEVADVEAVPALLLGPGCGPEVVPVPGGVGRLVLVVPDDGVRDGLDPAVAGLVEGLEVDQRTGVVLQVAERQEGLEVRIGHEHVGHLLLVAGRRGGRRARPAHHVADRADDGAVRRGVHLEHQARSTAPALGVIGHVVRRHRPDAHGQRLARLHQAGDRLLDPLIARSPAEAARDGTVERRARRPGGGRLGPGDVGGPDHGAAVIAPRSGRVGHVQAQGGGAQAALERRYGEAQVGDPPGRAVHDQPGGRARGLTGLGLTDVGVGHDGERAADEHLRRRCRLRPDRPCRHQRGPGQRQRQYRPRSPPEGPPQHGAKLAAPAARLRTGHPPTGPRPRRG